MKKLFHLFAVLAMFAFAACEENGGDNINPDDKTEQPGDKTDVPENLFFGLDKESVTISPDGGGVDVIVYSNYKWTISGTNDWCTPSVTSGGANEDGQKVSFSADVAYDTREATFWFRCADEKIKFTVSQAFKEVIIADENNTLNIPANGGTAVLSYQTNIECKIVIPSNAQSWLTLVPDNKSRALVSESATIQVAENTTYSARSAVIKVVAVDYESLVAEYTINQEQNDAIIADDNKSFNIAGWSQKIALPYQTNVECKVTIPAEAQSWISVATATRALENKSATLNIAANTTDEERSAIVKVVSVGNDELFAEYTISQAPRYYIEYTSTDGYTTVNPYYSGAFGATILHNEYIDGKGYIDFDAPVTSIGQYAFSDCSSLTSITIPDSVTKIGEYAFRSCSSLASITIPDSVTSIGNDAFRSCSSLTSVTIGNGVTSIRNYAFYKCSSLSSVTIGKGVTSIGEWAFYYCSSLTSITIPDGVTSIGGCAFSACTSLTSVYCKPTTPPSGYSYMFGNNASGRKIYVPTESVEAYKSAKYWSEYADYIVGYDF